MLPDLHFPTVTRPALLLALLLPVHADEVELTDGSRLAGTVTDLAETGLVMLSTPLSFEPFQIKADHLKRVDFTSSAKVEDNHDAMVFLANGDRFTADLKAIDADTVTVFTTFAGEIRVSRAAVKTVQLGVRQRKLIYTGPDADSWTVKGGWRYDDESFVAENSGTISRKFDIEGSFSLRFRVSWDNSPNIQVYFADDSMETTGKADRYYLQFGGSGLELKRQQSKEGAQQYLSMASVPGSPDDYPDNELEVELLVDRKLGFVHLYLDGEYIDKYPDPVKSSPSGLGVMFRSNIGGDDSQVVDRIEVREWDASIDRHRREERGDEKQDVLITRSSDRGTGSILGLTPGPDGGTVRYRGPHHPEPVDLPVSEVSTLFFARPSDAPAAGESPLELTLRGRGSIRVGSCRLDSESIQAKHPLLGDLSIRREAVASLVRSGGDAEESGDPQESEEEEQ